MSQVKAAKGDFITQPYQGELAQLYDVAVPDWPGEIAFYSQLVQQMPADHPSILEIACGTGRVTVQLANLGCPIVGIDLSDEMLAFAKAKCHGVANIRWALADMRSFELKETFGLAIVPAYSFQLLLNQGDRERCLRQIGKHLTSGARLALHLETHDADWLDSLPTSEFSSFETSGETVHPATHQRIRVSYAWSYDPRTRNVSVIIRYEHLDGSGKTTLRTDRGPLKMHCTSPHELQQQLSAVGFLTEEICGDFYRHPYESNSEEMIWVCRKT